jgi:dipeptidyl aminopeptidase/acylaminoacyl peptidase
MRPDDICRIAWVADPRVSPDGRRVAFVVTRLSQERDEYLSTIWVVPTAGGEPRQLTAGPKRDRSPRWSPDGTQLAFVSERGDDSKAQLYALPIDGGEPRRLTSLPNGVRQPAWSPDGCRLAFVSNVGDEPKDPSSPDSKPSRVITAIKYRFNGEGFTDRRAHVFVVDLEGGAPRQITDGDWADQEPAWSPDGRSIAFVSARHAERDVDNAADVWIVPAVGGEARRLTDASLQVQRPAFSPDGATIAFLGARKGVGYNTELRIVPISGGESRSLTSGLDRSLNALGEVGPVWSRDGRSLLVGADEHGNVPVYRVPVDGSASAKVVDGDRQVTGMTVAGDGTLVFAATDPLSPGELFVLAGGSERQLTDLNGGWRAEVELAQPERCQFERDGQQIDAWVMRPPGAERGQRYPVLLNIHGGPHSQYGNGFFDEFQIYAAAGYAVVFTNPRGSQGYGEAFTRAVVGDWGGVDYADVMAGLDAALERHDFLDRERLGVMGGSYGGYMTSWTVSHTDRFKAACSERALNDWTTFVGTSDIGGWFAREQHEGKLPWTDRSWYLERSPLTHVAKIHTPLLILHAEDDLRCPVDQGEQLFVALKLLGRETTFVRFPGENHEMSRSGKPRHRLERFAHILTWFGRYLR